MMMSADCWISASIGVNIIEAGAHFGALPY